MPPAKPEMGATRSEPESNRAANFTVTSAAWLSVAID